MNTLATICKQFLFLVSLCLVVLLLDQKNDLEIVRKPINLVMIPVVARMTQTRSAVSNGITLLPQSFSAAEREQKLQYHYNQLLASTVTINELQKENDAMREVLGLSYQKDKLAMGKLYQTNDGMILVLNQPVTLTTNAIVVQGKNLIGQIRAKHADNVYDVTEVTNPAFIAKVRILHGDRSIEGLAQGQYNTSISVTKILATESMSQDDLVVIHDQEKINAYDLVIGRVSKIHRNETAVFQDAQIVPIYSINQNNVAFVVQ